MTKSNLIIVGGGLVGLATGWHYLQNNPGARLTVLEKEEAVGLHQSGRNSGVLHSGIYYKPGSFRATMCLVGKQMMEDFIDAEGLDKDLCGKVIVARTQEELPQLDIILDRGKRNGVECEMIGRERLLEIEPYVDGIQAIHVPKAGIADYPAVAVRLAERIVEQGGNLVLGAKVLGIDDRAGEVVVQTTKGDFHSERLISCAGLYSDRIARMTAEEKQIEAEILPFRGEYFQLKKSAEHLVNGLIYPVPDPRFPFLGVHYTKMIEGGIDCGPNAVLAFAREGYNKTDFNGKDLWDALSYKGFRKLAFKYWQKGLGEMWRSYNKAAFVKELQKLIPAVTGDDLEHHPAGVRAMAITPAGEMHDDFAFLETERCIHVVNAPSPAATASLRIGEYVAEKLV